jgi:hypothetical protein
MEPESLLPLSQVPANCLCPESAQSSPRSIKRGKTITVTDLDSIAKFNLKAGHNISPLGEETNFTYY